MTITIPIRFSKAQFYDFVQREEGRYEWERGRIVQQQTGGTLDHIDIAQRIRDLLVRQLHPGEWMVTLQNRGVETAETIRYPDVVVEPAGADRKSLATTVPALVVEVLSESSKGRDLGTKPAEYTAIPTLRAYIVASQDEPELIVWLRAPDGTMPAEPVRLVGRDAVLDMATLGARLDLGAIYRGIGT